MAEHGERIDDLGNGLELIQSKQVFSFSVDAVLLAEYVKLDASHKKILEVGTGTGAIPFLLHKKYPDIDIEALEIQPLLVDMANRSLQLNLANGSVGPGKINFVQLDVRRAVEKYGHGSFDVIVSNPPYMEPAVGKKNENDYKAIARHEIHGSLSEWVEAMAQLLKSGGKLFLVYRSERLAELMAISKVHALEPKRLKLVAPALDQESNVFLLELIKNGRVGLRIEPTLAVYDREGVYSEQLYEASGQHADEQEQKPTGTLYLVATPIGNLQDISNRAIETLMTVDAIAAEDTRHSGKLLKHIREQTALDTSAKARLYSYHEHNRHSRGQELLELLLLGQSVALISDAGMPGISDPGTDIVKLAVAHDVPVVPIPGASASLTALIASGCNTDRFLFLGFLAKQPTKRQKQLQKWSEVDATIILYESPHRVLNTLEDCLNVLGDRQVAVARELTKKYEQFIRGKLSQVLTILKDKKPPGEYVIVIEGVSEQEVQNIRTAHVQEQQLSVVEHVEQLLAEGLAKKDAFREVAKMLNLSKRAVYQEYHNK